MTALDSLSGGAGNDTLNIVDAAGALNGAFPAAVTTSGIETVNITSIGTVGRNAVAAVTNAVVGQSVYKFSGTLTSGDAIGVTIGGTVTTLTARGTVNSVSTAAFGEASTTALATLKTSSTAALAGLVSAYATATSQAYLDTAAEVGTAAAAFVAYTAGGAGVTTASLTTLNSALSAIAGTTVALTIAQADAAKAASATPAAAVATADSENTAVQGVASTLTAVAALTVTGLGATVGTNKAAVATAGVQDGLRADLATQFAAAADAATDAVATASAATVTITGLATGAALPTISFSSTTSPALPSLVSASSITPVAIGAAVAAAAYDVSGLTDVTAVNANTIGGANVGAASTQAVTLTNTGGGTVTLAGGASQTVTHSGAATLSGSTGAVTLVDAVQGSGAITVTGGTNVSVTAGSSAGAITIGANTSGVASGPSGAVTVSSSGTTGAMGAITVNGGSSVVVTETASKSGPSASTPTAANTTQGAVTVNGTAVTTSVAVSQTAAKTKQDFRKAEAGALETVSVKFAALAAGQSVTVEGLTFTASATGSGLTAAQVASAFADLAIGAIAGKAGALGTYSGSLAATGGVDDTFFSGSASGDTVVFVSPTANTQGVVVTSNGAVAPVVTEVIKGVAAVTGNGQGGIVNGAVTVTDANYTPAGGTAGTGTKLGVIGTVTANNFATLEVNNSGLNTLNVTGGSGNITINDGSALAGASVLRSLTVNMGGQTGGILDTSTSNVQTLNLALTSASSLTNITMDGVTALNLSGSAALSALSATGLAGLSAVKTITLTGGAGLNGTLLTADTARPLVKAVTGSETLDLSGRSTLTSVDASASTGAIKVKVDTATATVVGGSGNDGITTAATVTKSISTGAGNDTVTLGGVTISANVDGGAGTDTLVMTAANAASASSVSATTAAVFKSYVSGFEVLQLGPVGANTLVNLADIGFGANTVVTGVGAFTLTLDQFANGGNLVIGAANAGTIELTNAVAFAANTSGTAASYAANSVNIEVTGRTVDTFDVEGDRTGTSVSGVTGGNVLLSNVGTVNISAQDTGSSVTGTVAAHTLTVTDTKAHVVNVVGNADLTLTLGTGTVPATISGSAMTGALTLNLGAKTLSGGFTVTGGAGDDVLTASSVQGDKLTGGAGDDSLTSNAFATTLTGGAGADTFVISGATAAKTIFTTITDFSAGDTLKLINTNGTETFKATKSDLSTLGASATLSDALNLAITGAAEGEIRWLQFGGDTYVVQNIGATATTFTDGTDVAVKLSGTIDLSAMGFSSSAQSLAFA